MIWLFPALAPFWDGFLLGVLASAAAVIAFAVVARFGLEITWR